MAEKRLFHAKIKNTADASTTDYEAFYEAHTVGSVRKDAGERFTNSDKYHGQAFTVEHETLTEKPHEFYDRLRQAETHKNVVPARVKGIGQRWEVQENETPFVTAAVEGGEHEDFPADEYGWSAEDERKFRESNVAPTEEEEMEHYKRMEATLSEPPNQTEDDRVGVPDDQDDYDEECVMPTHRRVDAEMLIQGWDMKLRAKPEFYDLTAIADAEDAIAEITRQDHMHAIAGFDVPSEDKKDNSDQIPTVEELNEQLEKLRKDPATYPGFDTDEIPVVIIEEKRTRGDSGSSGSSACFFI